MMFVIMFYGVWALGFIILLFLGWLFYDKRYKQKDDPSTIGKPSNGYLSTAEVFIDPKDGLKYRVYYNPRSGDREYVRED